MIWFKIALTVYLGLQIFYLVRVAVEAARERFIVSTLAFGLGALIPLALLIWGWLL